MYKPAATIQLRVIGRSRQRNSHRRARETERRTHNTNLTWLLRNRQTVTVKTEGPCTKETIMVSEADIITQSEGHRENTTVR